MSQRFARRRTLPGEATRPVPAAATAPGYAVLDVETSALSPRFGRIVEIAIVQTDLRGRLQHSWTSLINPGGPVGATHIHGIRPQDVDGAPMFESLISKIVELLRGRAIVAHNAQFDLRFLEAEFGLAGWAWPRASTLCTQEAARYYLPELGSHRLSACCSAHGIEIDGAHCAHADALATARLLQAYLDPTVGPPPLPQHLGAALSAHAVAWPQGPTGRQLPFVPATMPDSPVSRRIAQKEQTQREDTSLFATLAASAARTAEVPERARDYAEAVFDAIGDRDRTLDEDTRSAFRAIALAAGLGERRLALANEAIAVAVADAAIADGTVSREERDRVKLLLAALGHDARHAQDLLREAERRRRERLSARCADLPAHWSLGTPLYVGDDIVITGCDEYRAALEGAAREAGLGVKSSVRAGTAVLVSDGSVRGQKARDAETHGVRVVTPAEAFELIEFVQPCSGSGAAVLAVDAPPVRAVLPVAAPAVPRRKAPSPSGRIEPGARLATVDPSAVRAWARRQGLVVGDRGRLPRTLIERYLAELGSEGPKSG